MHDHVKYAHIQAAFKKALEDAMRPYKGRPLTPKSREEIKRKAIAVTRQMISTNMSDKDLAKFIDGILDSGFHS